jgi:hypothetical protein
MTSTFTPASTVALRPTWLVGVLGWWAFLIVAAVVDGAALARAWPGWPFAFAAAAAWGFNVLVLAYGIQSPVQISRPPILAAGFAFLMTLFGLGCYWATIQINPGFRVGIERAAWFVSTCTGVALVTAAVLGRFTRKSTKAAPPHLHWDWPRLAVITYVLFAAAAVGTAVTIRRIGYIPILTGDPTSARVEFPAIGGLWYRLSMLGGVVALLVSVQAAARRASVTEYAVGIVSLGMVGLYGPRFFVALPLGVGLLLWDRVRVPIRLSRTILLFALVPPVLAFIGYWREREQNVALLSPVGVFLYGTMVEFRDLGWALDYYGDSVHRVHGATLGSVVVPLLPSPVWKVLGIDKAPIYAHGSASVLADAMGRSTGQRIGAFGEFYMNFGWVGAIVGALLYGVLLGYLDDRYHDVGPGDVRGIFLALTIGAAIFAQIGQLDVFTSTLTGYGYPLALAVLLAARRPLSIGAGGATRLSHQ